MSARTVQFGEVCERIDYGFTASADYSITEPRLLRITDIQEGAVDWGRVPGCQINPKEEIESRLAVGDIVIARTGATTGKSFLIQHAPRAVFASYLIRLRVGRMVLPEYLSAFCQSELYWQQIRNSLRGAAQAGVNSTTLSSLFLPLPSLPEQKRVAELLDQAERLSRICRYALELSKTFLPAAFLELFGDPDKNPKKNSLVAAGELFDIQLGKMLDAKRYTGRHLKPYLGNANVQWGRVALDDLKQMDFPEDDFERFKLKRGDIMVCEGGEVGRTAIWQGEVIDCCYQKALHRLRRSRDDILSEYFLHYMRAAVACGLVARHSSTATIGHFSKETFEEFPVMLPPLELQAHFAALVQRHERLQARQREALRQTEHMFQSLLHCAFTTGV